MPVLPILMTGRYTAIDELIKYVKGPDFPTGGTIYGFEGVKPAFIQEGEGWYLRGKVNIETFQGREGKDHYLRSALPGKQGCTDCKDWRTDQRKTSLMVFLM